MRFSKWIVSLIVALNVAFAGAVFYVFLRVGTEPVTLIGCWFAFTTGELWLMASIKKTETKEGQDDYRSDC